MTYSANLKSLTFKEDMDITIGISKGTYVGLEPLPTKQELIDELKEEMSLMTTSEGANYRHIILNLEQMTDEMFLEYYDQLPPLELKDGAIIPVTRSTEKQ